MSDSETDGFRKLREDECFSDHPDEDRFDGATLLESLENLLRFSSGALRNSHGPDTRPTEQLIHLRAADYLREAASNVKRARDCLAGLEDLP